MLVVADTSPLRYLIAIDEIRLLPVIFGQVSVPIAVVNELRAISTPGKVRSVVESLPEWLRVLDPNADSVAAASPDLDQGERAALALALELKADLVLMDDAAGRHEAKLLGCESPVQSASCDLQPSVDWLMYPTFFEGFERRGSTSRTR